MTAPSPYADLYRQITASGRAALPLAIEDMSYIAEMIARRMTEREYATRCRVFFGGGGALEAAHKLAAWVMALPPHKRAEIERWLTRPPSNGR